MKTLLFSSSLLACVALGLAQFNVFFLDTACTSTQTSCGGSGTCEANSKKCSCGEKYTVHGKQCVAREYGLDNKTTDKCVPQSCYHPSECSNDKPKTCICPTGAVYNSVHNQCKFVYFTTTECTTSGSSCSNSNGECITNNECRCKEHFYVENKVCVQIEFRQRGGCVAGSPCGGIDGTCQADNQTCLCRRDTYVIEDGGGNCDMDSFYMYENCDRSDDAGRGKCSFGKGRCGRNDADVCFCDPGYVADGGMCVLRAFKPAVGCGPAGTPCGGGDGICTGDGRCRCDKDYFEIDGRCVKSTYQTNSCLPTDPGSNASCAGSQGLGVCFYTPGVCSCWKEAWFEKELNKCVSSTFDDPGCKEKGGRCGSDGKGTCLRNNTCKCDRGYFSDSKKACHSAIVSYVGQGGKSLTCVSARPDVWVAVLPFIVAALVPSRLWTMTSQ